MSQRIPPNKAFRSKRVMLEMKQSYLAHKAAVDQCTISRFENGETVNISVHNFVKIFIALDDHWDLEFPGAQMILNKTP